MLFCFHCLCVASAPIVSVLWYISTFLDNVSPGLVIEYQENYLQKE